ncbi:hypothetical protein [Methylobrevis pamukkalensis]|uniref:hypothetical protein n=1 Tax=Methylobrevis pamukkalensis TaxID=1439726 RepID=UPI0014720CE1
MRETTTPISWPEVDSRPMALVEFSAISLALPIVPAVSVRRPEISRIEAASSSAAVASA